jgi:hypothetical protein
VLVHAATIFLSAFSAFSGPAVDREIHFALVRRFGGGVERCAFVLPIRAAWADIFTRTG